MPPSGYSFTMNVIIDISTVSFFSDYQTMVKPLEFLVTFILVLKYCQGTIENIKISNESEYYIVCCLLRK